MADEHRAFRLLKIIGRLLYHLRVVGEQNIPSKGACVIAWNHIAPFVDGLTIGTFLERRPDCVTFGGHRLVARSRRREMQKGIRQQDSPLLAAFKARGLSAGELLKALRWLEEGHAVALAVEGETTWDGRLQKPLAPGAAWMSLRTRVPVVPMVLIGGYDIHPRWKRTPNLSGKVTIRVGEPFWLCDQPLKKVTDEDIARANQRIYDEMAHLLELGHLTE